MEEVNIEVDKVKAALHKIKDGVEKYTCLLQQIKFLDVSKDVQFQKSYNGFFRVRQKSTEFYDEYYIFMQDHKNSKTLSFEEILKHFYDKFNRIEASFSSKLLAMINPEMPIWDIHVLNNIGLEKPSYYSRERLSETIHLYSKICEWYKDFLKTDEAKNWIKLFDEQYPNYQISEVKKVDFILWQTREQNNKDMEIIKILDILKSKRKVFYSESDFQFSLAWEIHEYYDNANIRLEYPHLQGKEYIDIIVELNGKIYPIELKYKTLSFLDENTQSSTVIDNNEKYDLKNQGAQDHGRYDYLYDIQRIEKFLKDNEKYEYGYAILLTNDKSYWNKRKSNSIDVQFSISEEDEPKTGKLYWGNANKGTMKGRENPIELTDKYTINWKDYSKFDGIKNGEFRYCLNVIRKS